MPDSPHPGQQSPSPSSAALLLLFLRPLRKLPRMQSGKMWKLEVCVLCLLLCSQLGPRCVWATGDDPDGEVKIEVLFKPEPCTPKSKRGDLLNVHYDGFLAKDGSQFYCRSVLRSE